jgi:hypothetical protein
MFKEQRDPRFEQLTQCLLLIYQSVQRLKEFEIFNMKVYDFFSFPQTQEKNSHLTPTEQKKNAKKF